jgi:pimeloyl-ACP methyl ester carboxylesterase
MRQPHERIRRSSLRPPALRRSSLQRRAVSGALPYQSLISFAHRAANTCPSSQIENQHAAQAADTCTALLAAVTSVAPNVVTSVVLVYGSFADGSGWKPVADILKHDGYAVRVVQEPLTSFAADVAATRLVLDRAGPCVLVGHSWGGMIVTEAGAHPNVRGLVYVNGFEPEVGETAGGLQAKTPPGSNKVVFVGGGFVQEKPGTFHADFAADVPESVAHFMSISQAGIAAESFSAKATVAAWSQKPSYAVVSTQDRMINPELERFMATRAKSETVELHGSHSIFLSHPKEIAALTEKAATAAK